MRIHLVLYVLALSAISTLGLLGEALEIALTKKYLYLQAPIGVLPANELPDCH